MEPLVWAAIDVLGRRRKLRVQAVLEDRLDVPG
jgi:hypothetical protein